MFFLTHILKKHNKAFVGSNPTPAPELGQFMRLFCHKKLDLGLCGWGLLFEHRFTGKKMFHCPYPKNSFKLWALSICYEEIPDCG